MTEIQKQVKTILEGHGYKVEFCKVFGINITARPKENSPKPKVIYLNTRLGKLSIHTVSSSWNLAEGETMREDLNHCLEIMKAVAEIAPEMVAI